MVGIKNVQPRAVFLPFNAGGNESNYHGFAFADAIQNQLRIPVVPHLTGLYQSEAGIQAILKAFSSINIDHGLLLRGDKIAQRTPSNRFTHASDLVQFIKKQAPAFHALGACYPEGHYEANSRIADIENLKYKVNAGCEALVTQLVFDNQPLYDFIHQLRAAGVKQPVSVGIMPILNRTKVQHLIELTKVTVPKTLQSILQIDDEVRFRQQGLAFTEHQIADLVAHGVTSVHLYTLNDLALLAALGH